MAKNRKEIKLKQMKKLKLSLNKQIIVQLDKSDMSKIMGGDDGDGSDAFLSIWGSNCYDTDPQRHNCCVPDTTQQTYGATCAEPCVTNDQNPCATNSVPCC